MTQPTILILQHTSMSPAGLIGQQIAARGLEPVTIDAEAGCDLPDDAATVGGLVILGGVMNALDDERCRHFPKLLEVVRERDRAGRPTLGVCLGAQLMARAFGAPSSLGTAPQFGYVDLLPTVAGRADPLVAAAGEGLAVPQYHEDTFALPEGATLLLSCQRGYVQAFRNGPASYAFQCHFETTEEIMRVWAAHRAKAVNNPGIPSRLSAEVARHHGRSAVFGRAIADRWLDLVPDQPGPG